MKRITLYFHILMSLLITACSNEDITIPTPMQGVKEGARCKVTFNVAIPDATSASRALGEANDNSVKNLKLLVFDQATRLFLYESDATLTGNKTGVNFQQTYEADLYITSKPVLIHFIGTGEENNMPIPTSGNEISILSQLTTSGGNDAYWQRVSITNIIATEKTVTNESGGTNQISVASATGMPETVQLIRNFARVTLQVKQGVSFDLDGFVLVNTTNSGSVAPYFINEVNGDFFPTYDTTNDETEQNASSKYTALEEKGYTGVQPDKSLDGLTTSIPTQWSDTQYLYERDQSLLYSVENKKVEKPVFLIARNKITDSEGKITYRYYKIDILKKGTNGQSDSYYKIFRNFSYDITINEVTGDGYTSAEEAASNAASNNLSASAELKDLTNIAYNNERLFVNKTEIIWTSNEDITLKYKYVVNDEVINTEVTTLEWGEEQTGGAVWTGTDSNPNYTINSTQEDAKGFSTITIKHTGLPLTGYKQQEVTITAGNLSRTINIRLVNPYITTLGCSFENNLTKVPDGKPSISLGMNQDVYVYFSMPPGLPQSIFPLTFILSPEAHSITPTSNDMPVISLLNHTNNTMKGLKYGFEKVIKWNEYSATNGSIIKSDFKTSLTESATKIYLYNEYFNTPLYTEFENPEPQEFEKTKTLKLYYYSKSFSITSGLEYTPSSDKVTVTATHKNENNWSFTIKYKEGSEKETVKLSYSGRLGTYTFEFSVSDFINYEDYEEIILE